MLEWLQGEVAIVMTDIAKAATLWEYNAEAAMLATVYHNDLLRELIEKYKGYFRTNHSLFTRSSAE